MAIPMEENASVFFALTAPVLTIDIIVHLSSSTNQKVGNVWPKKCTTYRGMTLDCCVRGGAYPVGKRLVARN